MFIFFSFCFILFFFLIKVSKLDIDLFTWSQNLSVLLFAFLYQKFSDTKMRAGIWMSLTSVILWIANRHNNTREWQTYKFVLTIKKSKVQFNPKKTYLLSTYKDNKITILKCYVQKRFLIPTDDLVRPFSNTSAADIASKYTYAGK